MTSYFFMYGPPGPIKVACVAGGLRRVAMKGKGAGKIFLCQNPIWRPDRHGLPATQATTKVQEKLDHVNLNKNNLILNSHSEMLKGFICLS